MAGSFEDFGACIVEVQGEVGRYEWPLNPSHSHVNFLIRADLDCIGSSGRRRRGRFCFSATTGQWRSGNRCSSYAPVPFWGAGTMFREWIK